MAPKLPAFYEVLHPLIFCVMKENTRPRKFQFYQINSHFFLFLPGTMSNEEEQEEDDSDYINLVGYSIRWNPSNLYSHDHEQTDQRFQHVYPCK